MSRKIKVGILGLGRAGRNMQTPEIAFYPDKFEIVAAADHAADRRENLPDALRNAKLYASCEELVADPDVELVAIALRHQDHTPWAIRALEAGKFVSIDKPLAVNYQQILELKAVADRHPGRLFPRQNRRFEAPFQKALQLLETGVLGKLSLFKLYRSCGYCRRNDWMTMTEFAGGLLTNWGPHIIDQALRYLDAPVIDVWADLRSVISIGDGDDQMKILLRAANGRVADIEISGTQTMPGRELEIRGERGTLVYDPSLDPGHIVMRYVDPVHKFNRLEPHRENPPLAYGNFDETLTFIDQKVEIPEIPSAVIWSHIYDSIVNGIPFPIKLEESMEVVRITDLVFEKSGFRPTDKFAAQA